GVRHVLRVACHGPTSGSDLMSEDDTKTSCLSCQAFSCGPARRAYAWLGLLLSCPQGRPRPPQEEREEGMNVPILEVVDLHKRYGRTTALERVSFQVEPGEMFGLLGPNGAGKTTLLSIVSCLLTATSGEVRLLGRPVVPSDRELRRHLGIVPQEL